MEYKNRAKNRKIKRNIIGTINLLKMRGLNLSTSKKITLVGIVVGIISLFLKWINIELNTEFVSNSFSSLVGMVGYSIIIIHIILLFLIFSKKNKDKIKLSIDSHIRDYFLIIICGIFIIITSINTLNFIKGLQHFSSNSSHGSGAIIEICSGIFILIGGILLRKEFYKNKNKIYINDSEDEESEDENKENMTLPI